MIAKANTKIMYKIVSTETNMPSITYLQWYKMYQHVVLFMKSRPAKGGSKRGNLKKATLVNF